MKNISRILAIETSCDETAISIIEAQQTEVMFNMRVISNVVASQIDLHKKWGGVYPEVASRAHLESIIPVLEEALLPLTKLETKDSNSNIEKLNINLGFQIENYIDAIAVTQGPGLVGSLLMGTQLANILSANFSKPLIAINHLEGHIYSAFTESMQDSRFQIQKKDIFPVLSLVVSGGHTSLILMKDHLDYKTVGQTIDDACGEAFDKVARILDLGYPGGPKIEKIAINGDNEAYKLPLSMLHSNNLDFSFSGLKTAVLYLTKNPATGEKRPFDTADLAASFQYTVARILSRKTLQANKIYNPKTNILSGGVAANQFIREHFCKTIGNESETNILIPATKMSTDNALGTAIVGAIRFFKSKESHNPIDARPNWRIDDSY